MELEDRVGKNIIGRKDVWRKHFDQRNCLDEGNERARTSFLMEEEEVTFVGHQVMRALANGASPEVTATDAQFRRSNDSGKCHTTNTRKEIILAAGAISTPQLLQLSGIEDQEILDQLWTDIKMNLPTVGRNLQEQTMNSTGHSAQSTFNRDGHGPSAIVVFRSLKELLSENGRSNGSVIAQQRGDMSNSMQGA
ncbi:hypothetical protein ACEPAH_26 [Sanghuangporus vaninii]